MAAAEAGLFGKFKTNVADEFRREDAVKVAVYLNLTPAKKDEIRRTSKPGLTLLNTLADDDIINEDSIDKLCEALKDCHLNKAARIAKKEFENFKRGRDEAVRAPLMSDDTDTGPAAYNPETLRHILEENLTRDNCYELAIYFSLPSQTVTTVQESPCYAEKLLENLENRRIIHETNISALLSALKDRSLQRIANKIEKECEQLHLGACEDAGGVAGRPEEGSGDSSKCTICGNTEFGDLKNGDDLVALQCQNEECSAVWMVSNSTSSGWSTLQHGDQTFSYRPQRTLDLSKLKYEQVTDIKDLNPGDHIIFRRLALYDHHAILISTKDSSKLEVIHWTSGWPSFSSIIRFKSDATVSIKHEEIDFPSGGVRRSVYEKQDPVDLVLARAFQMKENGEEKYSLTDNNCESLAMYCKYGNLYSVQGNLLKKFKPPVQKVMSFMTS